MKFLSCCHVWTVSWEIIIKDNWYIFFNSLCILYFSVLTRVQPGQQKTRHEIKVHFQIEVNRSKMHGIRAHPIPECPLQFRPISQSRSCSSWVSTSCAATNPIHATPTGQSQHAVQTAATQITIILQLRIKDSNKYSMPSHLLVLRQGSNSKPLRTKEVTNWLAANLEKIFANDADKVRRILENHPFETDMNKLSSYILEIL